ncbi:MAG: hypothetical protein KDJ48_01700, partial [Nitratireductor sp.]|nr:hypothetical protein [Nitratireductor sp.]
MAQTFRIGKNYLYSMPCRIKVTAAFHARRSICSREVAGTDICSASPVKTGLDVSIPYRFQISLPIATAVSPMRLEKP